MESDYRSMGQVSAQTELKCPVGFPQRQGRCVPFWFRLIVGSHEATAPELRNMLPGERRILIFSWLRERGVQDLAFDDVISVERLILKTTPAKLNAKGGKFIRRQKGSLFVN